MLCALSTAWHAVVGHRRNQIEEKMRAFLCKYEQVNVQFFQLRRDSVRLSQLPINFEATSSSTVRLKTAMVILPLSAKPCALLNEKRTSTKRMREIYELSLCSKMARSKKKHTDRKEDEVDADLIESLLIVNI